MVDQFDPMWTDCINQAISFSSTPSQPTHPTTFRQELQINSCILQAPDRL